MVKANADKLGMNKNKPITNEEYLKNIKNLDKLLDGEGGITVEPSFGLVFKTRKKTGEKFFINLVTHHAVDEPEEKYLVDMDN